MRIDRPPPEAEDPPRQLLRLARAHELILKEARETARSATDVDDGGTVNLVTSEIIPLHEQQAWFIGQQVLEAQLTAPSESAEPAEAPASRRRAESSKKGEALRH